MFNFWRAKSAPLTSVLPFWSGPAHKDDVAPHPPQYNFGLRPEIGSMDQYPLIHAECKSRLVDVYLSTNLEHTFVSKADKATNVSYIFPLPPDASVHAFAAQIGNRTVNGVIKERREAIDAFNIAVASGRQAALLQQENIEVFQIFLGNIMPGQSVAVQIYFVSVVSYEGTPNTMRLTFPTYIAPRFGKPPSNLSNSGSSRFSSLEFTCSVDASSNITSISSPSHPITAHLGSLGTELVNGDQFDPSNAFVTLSSPQFLEKDIVLVINYKDMDRPRCVIESYSSEDGTSDTTAYALTLVPKFTLPPLPEQEYIFLVDRSGSMEGGKIAAVRSALQIMLKSLPNKGSRFNIVSFGSSQSTLWPQSVPYTAVNVEVAVRSVDGMVADMGGTQMKSALNTAFSCRTSQSSPTNVFVLTDGECWDLEGVHESIRVQVEASSHTASFLRVFCMGIGDAVSKVMCEGIANAGQGSAIYVTETEKPDRKLINLIRAAHLPPVTDLRIDWGVPEISPTGGTTEGATLSQWSEITQLSLFDDAADLSLIDSEVGQWGPSASLLQQHPPVGSMPFVMPGRRYSFFAIRQHMAPEYKAISDTVTLQGLIMGRPISIEVPTVPLSQVDDQYRLSRNLVHTIAARALIQDNEVQGNKQHVLSLGLRHGLMSSQTSFIAIDQANQVLSTDWLTPGGHSSPIPPPKYTRTNTIHPSLPNDATALGQWRQRGKNSAAVLDDAGRKRIAPSRPLTSTKPKSDFVPLPYRARGRISRPGSPSAKSGRPRKPPGDEDLLPSCIPLTLPQNPTPEPPRIPISTVESLAQQQAFDGSFTPRPDLYELLTCKSVAPNQPLVVQQLPMVDAIKSTLWCTILVLAYLRSRLSEEEDAWSLFAAKAVDWVKSTLCEVGDLRDGEGWMMEVRKEAIEVVRVR